MNETPSPAKDLQEFEIWNEGRKRLVVRDQSGASHVVTLRKVGLRDMQALLEALGNEVMTAWLYLDPLEPRALDWLERLEPESLLDILEKGDQINGPLFERWWARQQKTLTAAGVDVQADLQNAIQVAQAEAAAKAANKAGR